MRTLQEVFNKIQEQRQEQRSIKIIYREALESTNEYRDLLDKLEQLKARKKQLQALAWQEAGTKNKFETNKLDLKENREMLSDLALTSLMDGQTVKVVDRDNIEYEPKFSVSFKKGGNAGKV